ncbi:MAG: decarboxylase [Rhodobacteraceae bacterium]|nr:decarboxylase [Paracoccaceae bacterium]
MKTTAKNYAGSAIIAQLKAAEIKFVAAVPDIVTSDGLLWPIAGDPDIRLLRISREAEGIPICAAMSYNGTRAIVLMQQTGLMDTLNEVRAIAIDYRLPIVMMVGLQGKEDDCLPEFSGSYGVRVVIPVLCAMELPFSLIEHAEHISVIRRQIDWGYRRSRPHVILLGQSPELP